MLETTPDQAKAADLTPEQNPATDLTAEALSKQLGTLVREISKAPYTLPKDGPVSVRQVGRWLECSDSTVYRLVGEGVLPRIHRVGVNEMRSGGLARMDAAECWEAYHKHIKEQQKKGAA